MSGYFQRPSLRADTFQDQLKPTGGGLKAAFQTRITPQLNHGDNQPSGSGLRGNVEKQILKEEPFAFESHNENQKPKDGLKAAFERRSSEEPKVFERTISQDSNGRLRAPFERSYSQSYNDPYLESPSTSTGGLKAAFKSREQTGRMPDNISKSNSNPSLHVHYGNEEFMPDTESYNDSRQDTLQNDYPAEYHSIHRLSSLNNRQGGSNLRRAFEARTGGTTIRNLGKNDQKDMILENHANRIVSKMEQDHALMEDSPDAEELRRTALRDMPQCLTIKRCVKVKLSKSVSRKSKRKPLSCYKMFKYRISMAIAKLKINIKDLAYSFELWYNPLKKIEGTFGTGVASFFKLLRWLFLVNLAIAILAISFIIIPKAVYSPAVYQTTNWKNILGDLFTGEGFLTNTLMYYGSYTNETINSGTLPYSMSHAYFFTMVIIYFVSFAVLGFSAAKSYKRSFIETEGGLKNIYANKIFCGWDYNIATNDAALLKSNAIYNELKELLSDFAWKNKRDTFGLKTQIFIVQFFMNVLILLLMGATAYAIWYFLDHIPEEGGSRIIVTPVFINCVMTFLPMFLSFVVKYEEYKNPKVSLHLTLVRTFVLGGVTIGVLVTYWIRNNSNSACWETSLAQEMYRMIIFDFFISVLSVAVIDVCLYGIYKLRKDTFLEFDIALNTMQIIYNQTLFWVGLVVSPILPVVVVIKLFFTWYIRQIVVLYLCKPSAKTWRAAQTSTWFLVMTFLSLLCIGGVLGYIISYIPVSSSCGPFRSYEYIYEIVTKGVFQLQSNSTVWTIVLYITKPGVIALVLIGMCAKVYYLRAQANAQKEIVSQCRNMLVWSAKDKEYYYGLISQATKGQWQYKLHDKSLNPELYAPAVNPSYEGGDTMGQSMSNHYLATTPSSGTTLDPSVSTISFDLDADNQAYSNYKKYS